MWVFTNNAFVSAVAHRTRPGFLMVRARVRGDLETFFSCLTSPVEVTETDHADYRFRCVVDKASFLRCLVDTLAAVDYDNFKNSIPHAEVERHDAYMGVWSVMLRYQDRALDAEYDSDGFVFDDYAPDRGLF